MSRRPDAGSGRTPPPPEHQFLKGTSGNKRGRPKGTVSLKRITRKVALKKHAVTIDGRVVRKTLLQLVIETLISRASSGAPSMAALQNELRAKLRPTGEKQPGGLLVVPEVLSPEECAAQAEAHNATARDPSTYVNHMAEEFCKAVSGIPTALGEAILASHRRWGSLKEEHNVESPEPL
jgi:Family of unknown function (DUF5681)